MSRVSSRFRESKGKYRIPDQEKGGIIRRGSGEKKWQGEKDALTNRRQWEGPDQAKVGDIRKEYQGLKE